MALFFFLIISLHLFESFLSKPERLRSKLRKQGICGPSPSSLLGNLSEIKTIRALTSQTKNTEDHSITHGWTSKLFPHLELWRNRHGQNFVYSSGTIQIVCVKEMSLSKSLSMGKPDHLSKDRGPLLGLGISASSGPIWVHQRKIIAPQLYLDKVKHIPICKLVLVLRCFNVVNIVLSTPIPLRT